MSEQFEEGGRRFSRVPASPGGVVVVRAMEPVRMPNSTPRPGATSATKPRPAPGRRARLRYDLQSRDPRTRCPPGRRPPAGRGAWCQVEFAGSSPDDVDVELRPRGRSRRRTDCITSPRWAGVVVEASNGDGPLERKARVGPPQPCEIAGVPGLAEQWVKRRLRARPRSASWSGTGSTSTSDSGGWPASRSAGSKSRLLSGGRSPSRPSPRTGRCAKYSHVGADALRQR